MQQEEVGLVSGIGMSNSRKSRGVIEATIEDMEESFNLFGFGCDVAAVFLDGEFFLACT